MDSHLPVAKRFKKMQGPNVDVATARASSRSSRDLFGAEDVVLCNNILGGSASLLDIGGQHQIQPSVPLIATGCCVGGRDDIDNVEEGLGAEVVHEEANNEEVGEQDSDHGEGEDDNDDEGGDEEEVEGQQNQSETTSNIPDVTTQTTTEQAQSTKEEVYGKILKTSTPKAFINRIKKQFGSPPPHPPLCRLIPTEAIRKMSPNTERTLTRAFKKMGGYVESKGGFTVSILDLEGEETAVTEEHINSWSELWRQANNEFERILENLPDWGPYLKGKMLHILDGNNRYNAWMHCIAEGKFLCLLVSCYDHCSWLSL